MPTRTAFGLSPFALILAASLGCGGGSGADANPGVPECQRDESEGPESAVSVTVGQQVEGYLCPVEDEDWYLVELPSGTGLLGVELSMSSTITPVEPTYSVWSMNGAGEPDTVAAAPAADAIGAALDEVHCIAPDSYYLVVRDHGDNAQDLRHAYSLTVTTQAEPDTHEPNNDAASFTAITSGTPVQGAVACVGDQDWYKITVPAGELLHIKLDAEIAGFEPGFRLLDASEELVVEDSNPRGQLEATAIDTYRVLPGPGEYFIVVGDDDDVDADPSVMYTLTVDSEIDIDPNEPNNHPDEATELSGSSVGCGGSFTGWINQTGTMGSTGDNDWFELPLSGCGNGILEVEVELDYSGLSNQEQWDMQDEVQASVAMVRRHVASACSGDESCRALTQPCDDMWDCAGYFNNCLPEGLCAGATVCLPGNVCGANQTERHYTRLNPPATITQPPPANIARLGAPIFGDSVIYLKVGDFQANGGTPAAVYSLRVRVRSDPDTHEANNLYSTILTEDMLDDTRNSPTPITVGSSCNWTSGRISYENDVDWYSYPHPCPGSDCTLRLGYQIDSGAVEHVYAVYHGGSSWFDRNFGSDSSGALGGTTESDDCFYAYQGHGSTYYISVRDLVTDSRDWDSDQVYRLCVEKLADTCLDPPCQIYPETGCGPPSK